MRSGWDQDATHLSFKTSPPGGHKQWKLSWELDKKNNWRTRSLTHYHVDFNHFTLIHRGALLAMDEGYNRTSKAEIHNLITVDGKGCVGEKIWEEGDLSDPERFDLNCKGIHNVWRDVPESAIAKIENFSEKDGYIHTVGEASKMYDPELQLNRNARYIINSQLGYFIILDELESTLPHTYTWRMHSEKQAKRITDHHFEIQDGNGALDVFSIFPIDKDSQVDETVIEEIMTPQRPDDIRRIRLQTLKIENSHQAKNLHFLHVLQPKGTLPQDVVDPIIIERIVKDHYSGVKIKSAQHTEIFLFAHKRDHQFQDFNAQGKWVSQIQDLLGHVIKSTYHKNENS